MRVLRYRQHKRDGTVIQAEWLTNFSLAKLGSLSFYRMAKSRWEIENQGFNDGKNRYGMEHICHHQANSILIVWLLILLALVIERLYRLRFLRRGAAFPAQWCRTVPHSVGQSFSSRPCRYQLKRPCNHDLVRVIESISLQHRATQAQPSRMSPSEWPSLSDPQPKP